MTKKAPSDLATSLKAAKDGVRKRDIIDATEPKAPVVKPTPEQMEKAQFVRDAGMTKEGQVTHEGYRRLPLFETLFKKSSVVDNPGLAALRYYRAAHEYAAASPTRCALNDEGRGGGVPLCIPYSIAGMMLEDVHGGTMADLLERHVAPALLPTLRAVALDDKSFSQIAIERFGGRKQSWIVTEERVTRDGKPVVLKAPKLKEGEAPPTPRSGAKLGPLVRKVYREKIVPISGAHRQRVADEFAAALKALVVAHQPYVSTVRQPPPAPTTGATTDAEVELAAIVASEPAETRPIDAAYLDRAGRLLPPDKLAEAIRAKAFNTDDRSAA